MSVNKYDFHNLEYIIPTNRFIKWFNKNETKIINLFCKFIKKEKVYDCDFSHFAEYIFHTDKSCKDYNKGRIFNNEKKDV
jgi:hypothetical protein